MQLKTFAYTSVLCNRDAPARDLTGELKRTGRLWETATARGARRAPVRIPAPPAHRYKAFTHLLTVISASITEASKPVSLAREDDMMVIDIFKALALRMRLDIRHLEGLALIRPQ